MSDTRAHHETQPPHQTESPEREAVDPQLAQLQSIEAGGPLKRVEMSQMPGWLRVGGYVAGAICVMMFAFGLYMSFVQE